MVSRRLGLELRRQLASLAVIFIISTLVNECIDVCQIKGARKFAFTITAAWSQQTTSAPSMLRAPAPQISDFASSSCAGGSCPLNVTRGCSSSSCSYINDRRIGYRKGFVEADQPYRDRSVPVKAVGSTAGTTDVSQQAGIINCPTPDACGDQIVPQDYAFKIERLSRGLVYARYSFELNFSSDGDWQVFFEGCCRLPRCSKGSDCQRDMTMTGIVNNAGLPFHIRTGIRVGADTLLPTSSFRFEMPDLVMLRWNGVPPPGVCVLPGLPSSTISFQLQGFHADSRYSDRVRFRLGNAYEQGLYKCVEHSPILNVNGLLVEASKTGLQSRCAMSGTYPVNFLSDGTPVAPLLSNPAGVSLGGFAPYATPSYSAETPPISVDPVSGLVTFPVANTGVWQTTIIADTCLCTGGCDGCQIKNSVPVDFLIYVSDAQSVITNPHPPQADYTSFVRGAPSGLSGIAKTAPQTIPLYPTPDTKYFGKNPYLSADPKFWIQIQCGDSEFRRDALIERAQQIPAFSADFLRIGFRDYDDSNILAAVGCDSAIRSEIAWISPSNNFPPGISTNVTLQLGNDVDTYGIPDSRGFIDLRWTPRCEDRSQIGLFMLCFESKDSISSDPIPGLLSTPSPFNFESRQPTDRVFPQRVNPSCLFVNSIGPKSNPAPQIQLCMDSNCSSFISTCIAGCCSCCNTAKCKCQALGVPCCPQVFGVLNRVNTFTVRGVSPDSVWSLSVVSSFPCEADAQQNGRCLANVSTRSWPKLSKMKYGCDGVPYNLCSDRPSQKGLATTQLTWNLTGLTLADVSSTLQVCLQTVQVLPKTVDAGLWIASYGYSPTNSSCVLCISLSPQTKPTFVDGYTSSAPGPFDFVPYWEVAVGKKLTITLVAVDSVGGSVDIVLLPSAGTPFGAVLTEQKLVTLDDLRQATLRRFEFVPQKSHLGMMFSVSFQARSRVDPTVVGNRRDYVIQVSTTRVEWTISDKSGNCPWPLVGGNCLPFGTQIVTVGCTYMYNARADLFCSDFSSLQGCNKVASYNLTIGMNPLPHCDSCGSSPVSILKCNPDSKDGPCCGNNICDGAETGSSCPEDCGPNGFSLPPCSADECSFTPILQGAGAQGCCFDSTVMNPNTGNNFAPTYLSASIEWSPDRQLQGRTVLNCIDVFDQNPNQFYNIGSDAIKPPDSEKLGGSSVCVLFQVLSCQYCIPEGSTLRSVAEHYFLMVDWLSLYNTNPSIGDPEDVIAEERLYVGPTYLVKPGDTLLSIAGGSGP